MKSFIAALLGLSLVFNANASNFSFLQDSVMAQFSEDEFRQFRQFVAQNLDQIEDRKPVVWRSKSSSVAGKFMVTATYETNGITCRRSRFLLKSDRAKEPLRFEICKRDNTWAIEATPIASFTQSDWALLTETGLHTLNEGSNGSPFSFHNPETGNAGSLVALSRFQSKGKTCRSLAITLFSQQGQSLNGKYTLCQGSDGNWQRPPAQKP